MTLRVDCENTLDQGMAFIEWRLRNRRHGVGVNLNNHEAEIAFQAIRTCSLQFNSESWFDMEPANNRGVYFAEELDQCRKN